MEFGDNILGDQKGDEFIKWTQMQRRYLIGDVKSYNHIVTEIGANHISFLFWSSQSMYIIQINWNI